MFVNFKGTISGDNTSGDLIVGVRFACRASGDVDGEAAITAGRGKEYLLGANGTTQTDVDSIVAALESANGVMISCGTLTGGTSYTPCIRVAELRQGESVPVWGGWTDLSSGNPFPYTALSAPTGLTTTNTYDYIGLSWNAVSGASGYVIERSADNSTWVVIATTTNLNWNDNFIIGSGISYYYRVAAYNTRIGSYASTPTAVKPTYLLYETFTATDGNFTDNTRWKLTTMNLAPDGYITYTSNSLKMATRAPDSGDNFSMIRIATQNTIPFAVGRKIEVTIPDFLDSPTPGDLISVYIGFCGNGTLTSNPYQLTNAVALNLDLFGTTFQGSIKQVGTHVFTDTNSITGSFSNLNNGNPGICTLELTSSTQITASVNGVSSYGSILSNTITLDSKLRAFVYFVSFVRGSANLKNFTMDNIKVT